MKSRRSGRCGRPPEPPPGAAGPSTRRAGAKEGQPMGKVCTHCGQSCKKVTEDHAVAWCLWVETSNERRILVPSWEDCNCKSEEGLLKSFLSVFDERLAGKRFADELLRRQGKGDLRSFVGAC